MIVPVESSYTYQNPRNLVLQAPQTQLTAEDTPTLETCSCVCYMRELGHTFPRVPDPSYLEPDSPPTVGGLILLDLRLPHIGEIIDLRPGVIFYKERILFDGECLTQISYINYDDSRIRGFLLDNTAD